LIAQTASGAVLMEFDCQPSDSRGGLAKYLFGPTRLFTNAPALTKVKCGELNSKQTTPDSAVHHKIIFEHHYVDW